MRKTQANNNKSMKKEEKNKISESTLKRFYAFVKKKKDRFSPSIYIFEKKYEKMGFTITTKK